VFGSATAHDSPRGAIIYIAMILRAPTVTLRYPEPADAERIYELASAPDVGGWFSWGPYEEIGQAKAWLAGLPADREHGRDLAFAIEREGAGVIGVTSLNELSIRDRRAMVGTWIGRDWQGTGVNGESKALIAHLAFAICGMRRLGAFSDVLNEKSTGALERVGFTREGTLSRWHRHGGTEHDVHVFRLLPDDWSAPFEVEVEGAPPAVWIVAGDD
jgi:ribosomal-protein-alanine N-acetyltransferase